MKNRYRESWNKTISHLLEVNKANSKEKEDHTAIKNKFKKFNEDFDKNIRKQKNFTVGDPALNKKIKEEIKGAVVPLYKKFCERTDQINWSANKEKYQKYSPQQIEIEIESLFSN